MILELIERYRTRNFFDVSDNEFVYGEDLAKILRGEVCAGRPNDAAYFVVCSNGLDMLKGVGEMTVWDFPEVVDNVFNKSEWFGKFQLTNVGKIVVPKKYELLVNSDKKQICLTPREGARYWNYNLENDLDKRILRTDLGFGELRDVVNATCFEYEGSVFLKAWNNF